MTDKMQVANTILEQLGGREFIMMTGSKNFVGSADSLSFKVGKNDAGVNHCRVTLLPNDLYRIEVAKVRGLDRKVVASVDDVYCEHLRPIFRRLTGLETRAPRVLVAVCRSRVAR